MTGAGRFQKGMWLMQEIPVYFFTGFMDSGKTSLIHETLYDNEFGKDARNLVICCEDGDVEYEEEKLHTITGHLAMVENQEDLTKEYLEALNEKYHPQQVFLEYNGTWEVGPFLEMELPEGWVLVQSLATVDAKTFELYLANMRPMMMEQMFAADVVIFNRCTDDTPKAKFRRVVKALNRKAQIVYEREDGTIDEGDMEELPFDIHADVIDITDADYGIWYLDAMDDPKKYDKKKVHFLALVYRPESKLKRGVFVPGRFAMTCCEADIQFVGFKCKYDRAETIPHRSWIDLTAEVKYEFAMEYHGKGPVLYPISIQPTDQPEDELVYFS